MFSLAVHVYGKRQVLARLEQVQLFLQQQGIGAQVDVLLPRHQPLDDLGDLRMQQRLAARNRHHRRAALVHRLEALFRRELLLQNVRRILNLPASRARQVAAK